MAKLAGIELTEHPCYKLPTQREAEMFVRAKGAEAFANWCNEREAAIGREKADPYRYGTDAPIWHLVDDLLCAGKKVKLDLAEMYQGLYAYNYDYSWLSGGSEDRVKRAVAQFPKEIVTTGARELLIMGDNRSGKTEYSAKRYMKTLIERPERMAWALQQSFKSSVHLQQARVAKYLPLEYRAGRQKRSSANFRTTKITFSDATGFTDGVFVLPNRSKGLFYYYGQKLEEVEGNELDLVWADELIPMAWISAVRARLIDRDGLFLLTFTPVMGYTPEVKEFLAGAETLVNVPMRFFPGEQKPKVQRTATGSGHVVYFHSLHDNYFANRETWLRSFLGKSRNYVRRRGEGIAESTHGVQFAIFRRGVHVVRAAVIPAEGTNYHYCDPADGKPWCNFWLRVDKRGNFWIYREWPCEHIYVPGLGQLGAWATDEPDMGVAKPRLDGYPGDGQAPINWGTERYAEEFARLESGAPVNYLEPIAGAHGGNEKEVLIDRYMDSRARTRTVAGKEEGTNLEELCLKAGLDFRAASGKQIKEGVSLVDDWLYYDEARPVEPLTNEPRLHISEECTNLIWALEHWTGADGQKGACKDWIDLLRYAAQSDPIYVGDAEFKTTRHPGGGY